MITYQYVLGLTIKKKKGIKKKVDKNCLNYVYHQNNAVSK